MTVCISSGKFRKRLFIISAAVLLSLSLIFAYVFSEKTMYTEHNGKQFSLRADQPRDHHKFAEQLGLNISEYPIMIQKIRIPETFDPIYNDYNKMQKDFGLDLLPYSGRKCTLYTYSIIDPYNTTDTVLNIIIFRGRIIGGDVSESIYKGKLYGFGDI